MPAAASIAKSIARLSGPHAAQYPARLTWISNTFSTIAVTRRSDCMAITSGTSGRTAEFTESAWRYASNKVAPPRRGAVGLCPAVCAGNADTSPSHDAISAEGSSSKLIWEDSGLVARTAGGESRGGARLAFVRSGRRAPRTPPPRRAYFRLHRIACGETYVIASPTTSPAGLIPKARPPAASNGVPVSSLITPFCQMNAPPYGSPVK